MLRSSFSKLYSACKLISPVEYVPANYSISWVYEVLSCTLKNSLGKKKKKKKPYEFNILKGKIKLYEHANALNIQWAI